MTDSESATEPAFMYARSGIVPVRRQAKDASEMVTQLLLGETVRVDEILERWVHVTADFDGYTGWVNRNQMHPLTTAEYREWREHPGRHRSPYVSGRIQNDAESLWLPVGAPVIIDRSQVHLPDASFTFVTQPGLIRRDRLTETALDFFGTPYLWGGRTDAGIDCSGFIQTVYALHGSVLPRDSGVQFNAVTCYTTEIDQAEAGDIIYFNTNGKTITHVGFHLGNGVLLHASGNVKQNLISKKDDKNDRYPYDQRLAEHIAGIQSGELLFEYGKKNVNIPC